MKTTTDIILPNDYAVKIIKTKTTINSFKQYDTIDELKIKEAIKVLETIVKNMEEKVSILLRRQSFN